MGFVKYHPFGAQNNRGIRVGSAAMGRRKKVCVQLRLENLEPRCLLSTYRTYDGSGNNQAHPDWGQAGVDELRMAPIAYADGISTPARPNDPSTRFISNAANDNNPPPDVNSARYLSDYAYVWGQFIDHDIDLTQGGTGSQLSQFDIPVPNGDPHFDPD